MTFEGRAIPCPAGANLRVVLVRAKLPLYNGLARALNCRGFGTCGTCAVRVEGDVSEPTAVERWRLDVPPHHLEKGLRLACQTSVLGDVTVRKYGGLWGQHAEPPPGQAAPPPPGLGRSDT